MNVIPRGPNKFEPRTDICPWAMAQVVKMYDWRLFALHKLLLM